MTIKPGDTLPTTTFLRPGADGPEPVESAAFFAGRKVALISVPGAFTPTCSARHLPSFLDQADALKDKGVDEIACTSVTDPFVLGAWAKHTGAEGKVTMLADGNGDFIEALGLKMDARKFGMGRRGRRFSMIVDDGVVETLNVEEGGGYEVTSAENLLASL